MTVANPASPGIPVPAQPGRDHRPVDWYELFFDLVFVVVIAVSAETLEGDTGLGAVGAFMLLFFPLWWAWINLMVTNNLYGRRYSSMGVLVVAAMPGGIEEYAWLYAVGAAWARIVLLAMWLFPFVTRAVSVSPWRPLGLQPRDGGVVSRLDFPGESLPLPVVGGGRYSRNAPVGASLRLCPRDL